MDQLDELIAQKTNELNKIDAQLAAAKERRDKIAIELSTLRHAASLRPSSHGRGASTAAAPTQNLYYDTGSFYTRTPLAMRAASTGGRQSGAISMEWRGVLHKMWENHREYYYEDILALAVESGINTKIANVRERVRAMVANGLLAGSAVLGFTVTPEAAERFGFKESELPLPSQEATPETN